MHANIRKIIGNGDANPQKNYLARHYKTLLPLDTTLVVLPMFAVISLISLADCMINESEFMILDLKYFDSQIMQVIVPSAGNGINSAYVYGNWSRNRNNANQVHYYGLLSFRFLSKHCINKLCYVMENRNTNAYLWDRNVELHKNGTITTCTTFRVLDPLPIQKLKSGDLPMLETRPPIVVIKHPNLGFYPVQTNHEVQGNNHLKFTHNGTKVIVN